MAYKDLKWRKQMQISIDYNNMMADYVGQEQGFTDDDIDKNKKLHYRLLIQ